MKIHKANVIYYPSVSEYENYFPLSNQRQSLRFLAALFCLADRPSGGDWEEVGFALNL